MASEAQTVIQERCPTNVFRIVLLPEAEASNYQDVLASLTAGINANQDSQLEKVLDSRGQLIGYSGNSLQIGQFLYKVDRSLVLTGDSAIPLNSELVNLKQVTIAEGASRTEQTHKLL